MPGKKTNRAKASGRKKSAPAKKRSPKATVTVRESGPRKWLFPILESAYTVLAPREAASYRNGIFEIKLPKAQGAEGR